MRSSLMITDTTRRPTVLLLYLGRQGGGARYSVEVARSLRTLVDLHLAVAQNGELFGEFRALGRPLIATTTFESKRGAVYRVPAAVRFARAIAAYVRRHEVDVVYVPMTHIWDLLVLRSSSRRGARSLVTVHDVDFHLGERNLFAERLWRREMRMADAIVTLTSFVDDQLRCVDGVTGRRWLAPHAVPTPSGTTVATPRRAPPPSQPVRLLLVGRMLEYKGVDLFIETISQLRASGCAVQGHIAGSGPSIAAVRAQAQALDVAIDERWLDMTELIGAIDRADAVVLPYREATQSGIVPLAYSRAVPVVTTPTGGLPEQVDTGSTGVVAEAVDARSLADAVAWLFRDPARYASCSVGALNAARTKLQWSVTAAVVAEASTSLATSVP